mmetsp:Transcript_28225/g.79672  ORF Transcript_28225/g.79672 Transcript_28225/m.79672 type:complete len:208 (+) Transcript_28225:235-858(+)
MAAFLCRWSLYSMKARDWFTQSFTAFCLATSPALGSSKAAVPLLSSSRSAFQPKRTFTDFSTRSRLGSSDGSNTAVSTAGLHWRWILTSIKSHSVFRIETNICDLRAPSFSASILVTWPRRLLSADSRSPLSMIRLTDSSKLRQWRSTTMKSILLWLALCSASSSGGGGGVLSRRMNARTVSVRFTASLNAVTPTSSSGGSTPVSSA